MDEVLIPGGLEGKFTIPDLFWIKGNNFDPNRLPDDVHTELMRKMIRTYDTPKDEVDIFNALNFALQSPGTQLTTNLFGGARTRVRDIDELRELAARAEGPLGARQSDELFNQMVDEKGMGMIALGGLGLKSTPNIGNSAMLAKLILEKPEMFRAAPGETLRDVALRVQNQAPGFAAKASQLGVPWSDLTNADVSAVDLHMMRQAYPRLMADPEVGKDFRERIAATMNNALENPNKANEPLREALSAHEGKVSPEEVEQLIAEMPKSISNGVLQGAIQSPQSYVYRDKKTGKLGSKHRDTGVWQEIPESVQPDKLAYEPKKFNQPNPVYMKAMELIAEDMAENFALFPEQWRKWDRYRKRFEPHEIMHPDYRKLPRSSFAEMMASLHEHNRLGYKGKKGQIKERGDWRKLYYGETDPMLLAAMGGGGLGAAALYPEMIRMLEEKRRESQP